MKPSKAVKKFENEASKRAKASGHQLGKFTDLPDQEHRPLWRQAVCKRCGGEARYNAMKFYTDSEVSQDDRMIAHIMLSRTPGKHMYRPCPVS